MRELSDDFRLRIYHQVLIIMKARNPEEAAAAFKLVYPANNLGKISDEEADTLVAEMNAYLVEIGNPTILIETAILNALTNLLAN